MLNIDNFDLFPFNREDADCFYFFQLIDRNKNGNNKSRAVKSYYIDSQSYLDKKKQEMITIADATGCRIYMHPARRNKQQVALALLSYTADCIATNTIHKLGRAYSTVCGRSLGVEKRRIVDVDTKNSVLLDETIAYISGLRPYRKPMLILPTVNGYHLIYDGGFDTGGVDMRDIHKNNPTLLYAKQND